MRMLLMALMGLLVAAPALAQKLESREVEYTHGDVKLRGLLVFDPSQAGKRPAVLIFPEWWGRNDYAKARAEQLAQAGYIAFAADMYGDAKTTTRPEEAQALTRPLYADGMLMRERAAAALAVLKSQPNVDGAKVAAIGYCFGGANALELARSGAEVAAVVSFHGSLKTASPEDAKNIRGKVLVLTGGADPLVPGEEREAFIKEMEEGKVDAQMVVYSGAKHSFTNPAADRAGMPPVGYDKRADERSWEAMMDLFRGTIGAGKKS
ncbi:MAG: dienelactone hydrolase family protein [Phycisphaerales bacterium]